MRTIIIDYNVIMTDLFARVLVLEVILALVAAAEPEAVAAAVLRVVEPLDAVVGARPGLGRKVAEPAWATRGASC